MKNVNIVGIAPFNGLKLSMSNIAQRYSDITFECYIGDLNEGVKIAESLDLNKVDVIISRGGTALLLKSKVDIPVVEIDISVYDIIRAVSLAKNLIGKSAVVGFQNITDRATVLNDLLKLNIEIITIDKEESVSPILSDLIKHGYSTIISDQVTSGAAREMGLNSVLITSAEETISKSLDQAIAIGKTRLQMKENNYLLRKINENSPVQLLIYNERNESIEEFSSTSVPNKITQKIENYLMEFDRHSIPHFNESYNGKVYAIHNDILDYGDNTVIAFYITATEILAPSSKATTMKNIITTPHERNELLFNYTLSVENELKQIKTYAESNEVVLILGEPGTHKEKIAYLFSESANKHKTWVIDCSHITKTEWQNLLNSHDSPLQDENATIFLKEVTKLGSKEIHKLLDYANKSLLFNRNKLILSSTLNNEESSLEIVSLFDKWPIVFYTTSRLRDKKANLPALASFYINEFNNHHGRHVIGFEPKALERLINYDWPTNQQQFKRVIKQLVMLTRGSYIKDSDVKEQLKDELREIQPISNSLIQLDQTLEEINKDIIQLVLQEEKGNKTKTAKRLGISRSTLWRILSN